MQRKLFILTILISYIISISLYAEPTHKIAVEIISRSEDQVGTRFVFRIKEKIIGSNIFRQAKVSEPRLQLIISSIERDHDNPGESTVYSIIWTYAESDENPTMLNHTLGVCGADRVGNAAESILAETDKIVEILRKVNREKIKKQNPSMPVPDKRE